MKEWKKENLVGALGGMMALLGLFLPYVRDISFFQSFSSPRYGAFAPGLVLGIALAAVLYALGLDLAPCAISWVVLGICVVFPGSACWVGGVGAVFSQLRVGAWVLLGGALLMVFGPLFFRKDDAP